MTQEVSLFLAGSIEMGAAELWQDKLVRDLTHIQGLTIYNPRRDDWDSSWVQDPTPGTQFHEQVSWELAHMAASDIVGFYFDPNTKSPITMMELGLAVGWRKPAAIFCTEDFFRYGNIVITAALNTIPVFHDYDDFKNHLLQMVTERKQEVRRIKEWQQRSETNE